jgi:hypothetical protein
MRTRSEKRGFAIHATIYAFVNTALTAINLALVPQFVWFPFPLVGWGFGLTMHYIFGVRRLSETLDKEQAEVFGDDSKAGE